jgi:demethylmenaquinone methyltransferase / 2-methoxy-6-polyprenyl-1,4-benzoquinol methylase
MFERLAPDYDRINELITLGMVRGWRRAMIRAAGVEPGHRVLDVCTGTGAALIEAQGAVGSSGLAVGVDFTPAMLVRAHGALVLGDALRLPFPDGAFDATVSAFALRDVADQGGALAEMARVTRPRGGIALVEVGRPRRQPLRLGFDVWFRGVVPRVATLLGQGPSHRFLVRSLDFLPEPEELVGMLVRAGVERARWRDLSLGAARLFWGWRR